MKRIILAILCLCVFASFTVAQDSTKNLVFGGFRYDNGPLFSFGYARDIVKGPAGSLYTFNYTDFGNYQSVNSEIAYMFNYNKFYVGPIAGPNSDWYGASELPGPAVNYIVGAAGGLLAYNFTTDWGAWAYGKYKFTFADDNMYKDGFVAGLGLYYSF